jgi:hypothetical protein
MPFVSQSDSGIGGTSPSARESCGGRESIDPYPGLVAAVKMAN